MSATPTFGAASAVRTVSKQTFLALSIAVALALSPTVLAQTTAPTTTAGILLMPPAATSTAPAPTAVVPVPTSAAVETSTQQFVGTVVADKVYVRSGPGGNYYEMGQLSKGDLVQVVGSRLGWYQILPPNGTFCMVAKDLVEVDSAGTSGTVKADYVNVRAGTALSKLREPSAVLTVVRKGTKLNVLGSTDKYYEIAPPEKAYVFVSPQFVKSAGAGGWGGVSGAGVEVPGGGDGSVEEYGECADDAARADGGDHAAVDGAGCCGGCWSDDGACGDAYRGGAATAGGDFFGGCLYAV